MSRLRNMLRKDMHNRDVDPDKDYVVLLYPPTGGKSEYEMVSGEDILAAADYYDQVMQRLLQRKDSKDDDA